MLIILLLEEDGLYIAIRKHMFLFHKKHGVYLEWYNNEQPRAEHDYVSRSGKTPDVQGGVYRSLWLEAV